MALDVVTNSIAVYRNRAAAACMQDALDSGLTINNSDRSTFMDVMYLAWI
jgi:hypothetical protein